MEVDFIREYSDTTLLSQFYYEKPIELNDGFLLFGTIQQSNYFLDGFVRKIDKQGHTLWYNYYGDYNLDELFRDMYPINDSTWVIAGISGDDLGVRAFLKLIDLQGDVINSWESEVDTEIGCWIRKIFPTEDKGYITYALRVVEVIGFTRIVQSTLAKLDSNFQIEWVQPFGRVASSGAEELWDIEPTSDGHFIGAGESFTTFVNDPNVRAGWLYKFSMEGDSLWGRRDPVPLPLALSNKGFFGGVGELSSGNIIAVGGAQEGAIFSGWLVKVSPDGCLDTLCNLSTAIEEYLLSEDKLRLYPNPSNGVFNLELPIEHLGKQAMFIIFDLQGQQIWQEERKVISKMEFDVPAQSSGLHFLNIEIEGRWWTEKFFVY